VYYLIRLWKAVTKRYLHLTLKKQWDVYKLNLSKWEGCRDGDSCVVVCNGPSLRNVDMKSLKDFDCFALNRSYMAYGDWGFDPKYFVCVNELVLGQFADDIQKISAIKFLNYSKKDLFSEDNTNFLRLEFKDRVVDSLTFPLSTAATVTFVAIQLALIMGYKRISIVGLDHSFSGPGRPNQTLKSGARDENHFLANYFSGGIKWEYPDLERNEKGYNMLREYADSIGAEIFDCTEGGKSRAFRKLKLTDFLAKKG